MGLYVQSGEAVVVPAMFDFLLPRSLEPLQRGHRKMLFMAELGLPAMMHDVPEFGISSVCFT